jgi:hypothetical protein
VKAPSWDIPLGSTLEADAGGTNTVSQWSEQSTTRPRWANNARACSVSVGEAERGIPEVVDVYEYITRADNPWEVGASTADKRSRRDNDQW